MQEKELGEQIRKLRNARKMTLAVVAERIGVTTSAIAAYENGSRTPSVDVLIRIARLFHVSVDHLLGNVNRDVLDVTDLTADQRNSVMDMIIAHRKLNEAMAILRSHNLMMNMDEP